MNIQQTPFKFLDAYSQADEAVFFGREQETKDLYNALSGVKHLLVYGPSGAGKTSLIECGLRNQFYDADWFALSIRRGQNITESVFRRINEALDEKVFLDDDTHLPTDPNIGFGQAIERLFEERFQPVYLLFDQFEELLILGSEEEKRDFFMRLHQLIRYKVPCRVLLIMREEFIGHLSEFEPLCPSIFQYRFRLEKMRKEKVRTVIKELLEAPEYTDFFSLHNVGQLADSILAKLPDTRREIELTHVQVFLSELWDKAKDKTKSSKKPELHSNLIAEDDNLEEVLDSFLKKQLKELGTDYLPKNLPLEVLASMISERNTKLQISAVDIQEDLDKKGVAAPQNLTALLQELEKRRLIRTLKAGEQTQYEISHDLLALVVGQNLTDAMQLRRKAEEVYKVYADRQGYLSQEDLDYLRPFEAYRVYPAVLMENIAKSKQHLKKQTEQKASENRKRIRRLGSALIFALVGLMFAGYFWWNANEALVKVETAQAKNQKLIDAFYFYDDKLALAYKEYEGYGFINKEGDVVIDYQYDKAEQFDEEAGFAKVTIDNSNYLIDTTGKEYKVAYQLEDLDESITALDLSVQELGVFPKEVLKYPQLEILREC